jgi:hypothetical protein
VSERRSREEAGLLERRGAVQVISIDTERFIDRFLRQIASSRVVLESEEEKTRTAYWIQQVVVNLATKILRTWSGVGNVVMSVYSEEAMKLDFKRKVLGMLETANSMCDAMIEEMKIKLAALEEARSEEERRRLLAEVDALLTEITLLPHALALALDAFMGVLQANLPVDLMPNIVKSHMGHVTT